MADEEAEQERSPADGIRGTTVKLRQRLDVLKEAVRGCDTSPAQSSQYCQDFCRTLLELAGCWQVEAEPLALLQVYTAALWSFAQASPFLSLQCEDVPLVIERLSLSFLELLVSVTDVPDEIWEEFKSSVQCAEGKLRESGLTLLPPLSAVSRYEGVWTHPVLQGLLSDSHLQPQQVEEFLQQEGPVLLQMRVKQLMKEKHLGKAALLAKTCSACSAFQGKGGFRQMFLVCLCATLEQNQLMEELSQEDCRDALEMICNLESDGDDSAAFSLCSAFLTRQFLQGDTYCAWELTLFWSKLLKRLEPSDQAFLDHCCQMSVLSKSVYHILFLIKVIQSEIDQAGLPVCIEMCIRALQMESEDGKTKSTVYKTISCLLPTDLEVKRACQLTEFLLEPTVDAYYAVETLYNEPDQKLEEVNMRIPNSLRCELLLVLKTQWPFDPEFWDWKTLKRHCLELMGEEASIVSSIDSLNDTENPEEEEGYMSLKDFNNVPNHIVSGTYELQDISDKRQKNREMKKLREKGFISARFRNWQAYMQYCVLCDKEFLGHRIVRHAQTHLSSGTYTCPICAQTFTSKDVLIPHVTSHVKQSCEERLAAMKTNKSLANPQTAAPAIAALKIKTQNGPHKNGNVLRRNEDLIQNGQAKGTRGASEMCEENMCPVGTCRRSFKFFKNLIAHVKGHGDNDEAKTFLEMRSKKVVCQYCRRHFVSVTHLNDHLQVHCGAKPYICIQLNCKASFLSNTELLIHRKAHSLFKARCMFPNCGKIFNAAFKLYDHEAQHYKTFTCKVVDCGKVFHSQQQLELHQEKHAALKEESPFSAQLPSSEQPGPSLVEQILSSKSLHNQEPSQEDVSRESACNPNCGKLPVSDGLLRSTQESVEAMGQCRVKSEPQSTAFTTSQAGSVISSVIKSIHSRLLEPNRTSDCFEDYRIPHNHPVPPFEASVGNHSQSKPKMFPGMNADAACCISDCDLPLPAQQMSSLLPVPLSQISREPAMSQPLPPTVSAQHLTGNKPVNPVAPSDSTGPPPGQRERFHCAFGTCTRHYSSYRSVAKHMKTVHSDFYEQWKITRTKIKTTYAPVRSPSSVGHFSSVPSLPSQQVHGIPVYGVHRQNVIQSPPYANRGTISNYAAQQSLSPLSHSQNSSLLMGNVLNPIVLSQLGTDRNPGTTPSQFIASQNWHTVDVNKQIPNSEPPQVFSSNLQEMLPVDSSSGASISSCSMMGSVMSRPDSLQQHLMESRTQSIIASNINHTKEMSQQAQALTPCASQMENSFLSDSTTPEKIKETESHEQSHYSPLVSISHKTENNQPQNGHENSPGNQKQTRKHRSKCPAIIRDGKFVCRRCFRQFDSPRSLGGHLSKRTICKPYQESELNADLPNSFLDLFNSEKIVSTSQSQLTYDNAALYQKPSYPLDNLPAYGNGETNDDILKQIMAESNMSDLFVHSSLGQPLFQRPCAPYGATERLHGSVIQHTENLQLKHEDIPYSTAHYPQPSIDTCSRREFAEPLLSQILTEDPSTSILGNAPRNTMPPGEHHSDMYRSEMAILTNNRDSNSVIAMRADRQLSQAVSCRDSETQRKTAEQDIKRRLREQILAGDFQRRSMCHPDNPDPKASPMSLASVCSPSSTSGFHRMSHDPNDVSAVHGQVFKGSSVFVPPSSGEIKQLLNTQSFTCFRDTATTQQKVPSPTSFVSSDTEPEPSPLSTCQQQCMKEIQCAFERLNLVRETSDQKSASVKQSSTNSWSSPPDDKAANLVSSIFIKPFACECCSFSSISSDALWKHLSKTHNYTLEMVNVVKKRYGQYAPFKCQKCGKAFTRNSNLRTHYMSLHKLSAEEISEIDVKRKLANPSTSPAVQKWPDSVGKSPANCSRVANTKHPYLLQNAVKSEALISGINRKSRDDSRPSVLHPLQSVPMYNQEMTPQAKTSTDFLSGPAGMPVEQYSQKQQRNLVRVNNQHAASPFSPKVSPPGTQDVPVTPQAKGLLTPEKGSLSTDDVGKPSMDITVKTRGKKPKSDDPTSPYRPYRCVHQGCVAAFTIQHNLILHYRSVHQSALLALEVNKEQDQSEGLDELLDRDEEPEAEFSQVSEFRCQVKDCCCVFQEVPNLLQHYFQLHKFTLDKVAGLLSGIKLGTFTCGHKGCTVAFTALRRYVGHVKEEHKDLNLTKPEQLNVSFRCEIEGCDRSYATKSNLLRHVMKKHQDLYQHKLKHKPVKDHGLKQKSKTLHYQIAKTSNGKENIESNKKVLLRAHTKKVSRSKNHWVKYGKPSLKSKLEASAMCTKKFPLQYPCMIKGCELVLKTERSILKHYMGHGLSDKYLEQHRSHFIFCRKFARQKCHSIRSDDSKSDNTSDQSDNELPASAAAAGGEYDDSKPVLRRRIPALLFDSKLSNDESSNGSVVLKRKRGRPRKFMEKIGKRKKISHATKTDVVYVTQEEPAGGREQSVPLASFKPMGFEMSFLKFLEQSNKSEHSLIKTVPGTERSKVHAGTKSTYVKFSNRQKLKSLCRVRISLEPGFSGVAAAMLEQLQDMHPAVVLENLSCLDC